MKKLITITLILTMIIFSSNVTSFASSSKMNANISNKSWSFYNPDNSVTRVDMVNNNEHLKVFVYLDGKLDHMTIRKTGSDEIVLTKYDVMTGNKVHSKSYNANDFLKDSTHDTINNKKGIMENSLPLPSYYDDPPSTPTGYQFATSVFSSYHNSRGYLFKQSLGEISRDSEKRIQFSAGTLAGIFVSVVALYITGSVTLEFILYAMGTSIIADNLASYVNSDIWFSNHKTLYKGFCKQIETLNTFQILKYNIIYDYKSQTENIKLVGYAEGYYGYNGNEQDMAYSAIVNYFN